jgi:hypothetical protein
MRALPFALWAEQQGLRPPRRRAPVRRRPRLKAPRLQLLGRRGPLRIYLVDSTAVRKIYGDFTMGGHDLVYPDFVAPREVWIADELAGLERQLTTLHELHERRRMAHGMGYDEAHDLSTQLEQRYRHAGGRGLAAALRRERGR